MTKIQKIIYYSTIISLSTFLIVLEFNIQNSNSTHREISLNSSSDLIYTDLVCNLSNNKNYSCSLISKEYKTHMLVKNIDYNKIISLLQDNSYKPFFNNKKLIYGYNIPIWFESNKKESCIFNPFYESKEEFLKSLSRFNKNNLKENHCIQKISYI